MRDVGIEVIFAEGVSFRGIRANQIYSALLELGEVTAFRPNFVIANDDELGRFWLALRTTAPWERIEAAVRQAVEPGELDAVREVAPEGVLRPPEAAAAGAPPPQAGGRGRDATEEPTDLAAEQRTIRVDLERLETLSNLVGELAVEKAHLANLATRLEAICTEGESRRLAQDLRRSVGKLSAVSGQLQELSTELRMVPVGMMFRRFTRLVRELAAATGKPLTLRREGEDTMLDKAIVEEMVAPLLHLIRNAADHGIEPPDERRRAGKPETGTITLRAFDQGDEVLIEVEDDGRGMDVARIRAKAVEKGLITAETAVALSDQEVLQLVFQPGFSTTSEVTDISGRGVGMDVVKASVEQLRGSVHLQSDAGRGTRVTIRLPLTVSILQVMLAQVGDQTVAVPMSCLTGLVRIGAENRVLWGAALRHQDRLVPLVELGRLWWQEEGTGASALLVRADGQEFALLVDRPLGLGDVVVKPLGDYVGRLPGVAGAAILADGRVALVLDPSTLLSQRMPTRGAVEVGTPVSA
ncbi:chemotaxis protein CheA [Caldinitratiruptor microaerophilus]|uniref:chemotaxis protein CheA n=1 Tax=Caldinitratiruptor microaerophilus TaxID=671077 RepID=UPI00222FC324|nr:chemotaxis protein CheA [Caldinitratiruptor microaerophilus]